MLVPVFSGGKQVYQLPSLDEIRSYHKKQLAMFRPEYLRKDNPETYSVYLSDHVKNTKMALLRQHNQNFHEDTEAEVIETS
jgi:nicotinate phosphoribosyltransferase